MAQVCPISTKRVDANMARVIAFEVALLTVALLVTQESIFAMVMLFDFTMRTSRLTKYSPLQIVGHFLLTSLDIAPKFCDESPKRFALYLGLATSLFLLVAYVVGFVKVASIVTIVLIVCALLEAVFDFCLGCKVYYCIQVSKGFLNYDRNIH